MQKDYNSRRFFGDSMLRWLTIFSGAFAFSNGQDVTKQVESLVQLHQVWGPKSSTPGASLAIQPGIQQGQVMKFRLVSAGAPRDVTYSIIAWPVTQKGPSEVLRGVTLNDSGLAICAGRPGTCGSPDKPDDPIDLALRPASGEPVRLGLVSVDGKTKAFAKLVPVPLRGEDKGCGIEATLLTPGGEAVLIEGTGFPPNSDIAMDSESGDERHSAKGKVDSEGRYSSALLPYRRSVTQGTTNVALKSGTCAPSVNVTWGRHF